MQESLFFKKKFELCNVITFALSPIPNITSDLFPLPKRPRRNYLFCFKRKPVVERKICFVCNGNLLINSIQYVLSVTQAYKILSAETSNETRWTKVYQAYHSILL